MANKTQIITVRIPRHTKEVLADVDMRKFLENMARMIEIGAMQIENNEIVLPEVEEVGLNLDDFYDACHAKNQDPQKMLDKCTQMVWKA